VRDEVIILCCSKLIVSLSAYIVHCTITSCISIFFHFWIWTMNSKSLLAFLWTLSYLVLLLIPPFVVWQTIWEFLISCKWKISYWSYLHPSNIVQEKLASTMSFYRWKNHDIPRRSSFFFFCFFSCACRTLAMLKGKWRGGVYSFMGRYSNPSPWLGSVSCFPSCRLFNFCKSSCGVHCVSNGWL
jgi:hypothetical protein